MVQRVDCVETWLHLAVFLPKPSQSHPTFCLQRNPGQCSKHVVSVLIRRSMGSWRPSLPDGTEIYALGRCLEVHSLQACLELLGSMFERQICSHVNRVFWLIWTVRDGWDERLEWPLSTTRPVLLVAALTRQLLPSLPAAAVVAVVLVAVAVKLAEVGIV